MDQKVTVGAWIKCKSEQKIEPYIWWASEKLLSVVKGILIYI